MYPKPLLLIGLADMQSGSSSFKFRSDVSAMKKNQFRACFIFLSRSINLTCIQNDKTIVRANGGGGLVVFDVGGSGSAGSMVARRFARTSKADCFFTGRW